MPTLQGQKTQSLDPLGTTPQSSNFHSPHQWLRSSHDCSLPLPLQDQNAYRMLGFSSLKELARTSRRPLAEVSVNAQGHTLKPHNSLYGTLRDQCTPPPPSMADLQVPLELDLRSKGSSIESLTPDLSTFSKNFSHPTTPASRKHHTNERVGDTRATSMTSRPSAVAKNPFSIRKRFSLLRLSIKQMETINITNRKKPSIESLGPPQNLSQRASSRNLQIPRRRSSLTVLHLDSSHFETLDPKYPKLHNRASTLTEPGTRRASTLTESLRLIPSSSETLRPLTSDTFVPTITGVKKWNGTLSPPLLASMSRTASNSSRALSDNLSWQSVITNHIHLPKTFPDGPISVPAPRLGITHYKCFSEHRRMLVSRNNICPVPCMICKEVFGPSNWKCEFCSLRVCGGCMAEFQTRRRDLENLVIWAERIKEEEQRVEMAAAEVEIGSHEVDNKERERKRMEELGLKRIEMAKKRETR